MQAPVLLNTIPTQMINERAAYGPFDLKKFVQLPDDNVNFRFRAELTDGRALPTGMICTTDGILTGIPAKNTSGNYDVILTVENEAGFIQAPFMLIIKPSLLLSGNEYLDKLKAQIWSALNQNLPIPDLEGLYERPITIQDIYHLLERWGTLTIWDAFNLDPPSEKRLLTLEGASSHYHIYDCGSCLIATPVDLFSHERTVEDGLQTARVMAREVYKRHWTIEFAGFDRMIRAAWIEIQHLVDQHGRGLEIINFTPTLNDMQLYKTQSLNQSPRPGSEI